MNSSAQVAKLIGGDVMFPTSHEKSEWSRLARQAYARNRNDIGHRYSTAAALPFGESLNLVTFDTLQAAYRVWLVEGFNAAFPS